ncbi:hypothetical protein [uncultured Sphaerochaeta sp.]|uniref:hypothetical protein n=1 Tax=uncultured Sphaerochaeta sp. TaxID=886478 RepID=UPI0029C9BCAA|nr:hypothetical protein [uncultured Sphaerochaeta sp.]
MAVVLIPPNTFSEEICERSNRDGHYLILLLEKLKDWNCEIIFYISDSDWYIIRSDPSYRDLVYYLYSSTQIPFLPYMKKTNCGKNIIVDDKVASYNFTHLFLGILNYETQIPLIIAQDPMKISKLECQDSNCPSEFCRNGFELNFPSLCEHDLDYLYEKIKEMNLVNELIYNKEFSDETFIEALGFYLQFLGTEAKPIAFDRINCCPSFLKEFNQAKDDKMRILLSVLRMVAFPSAKDGQKAHLLSIDWHPHTRRQIRINSSNYSLFRCDVVNNLSERGVFHSGAKRVLLAVKKQQKILLCYTAEHDIPDETIRSRLLKYENETAVSV